MIVFRYRYSVYEGEQKEQDHRRNIAGTIFHTGAKKESGAGQRNVLKTLNPGIKQNKERNDPHENI
jgi:hypothetical protein